MSDHSQGPGWWQASDGKWYRPEQHPSYRPAMPPPAPAPVKQKAKRGCVWWVGLIVIVLTGIGVVIAIAGGDDAAEKRQESIDDDATVTGCRVDAAGFMVADVQITNNSSDRSNYSADVAFTSPDGATQYGSGSAIALNLASGQTTNQQANSLTNETPGFVCVLTDVFRFTDEP